MEFQLIKTIQKSCCQCKGHGTECKKFAWIYCDLRRKNEDKFDGDCGENLGCNHFVSSKELDISTWLENTINNLFMNFLFYDRKADEEMNDDKIRKLMDDGTISKEMMIKAFNKQIEQEY